MGRIGIGIYFWPKYQCIDPWQIYLWTTCELLANRELFAEHWLTDTRKLQLIDSTDQEAGWVQIETKSYPKYNKLKYFWQSHLSYLAPLLAGWWRSPSLRPPAPRVRPSTSAATRTTRRRGRSSWRPSTAPTRWRSSGRGSGSRCGCTTSYRLSIQVASLVVSF